MGGSKLCGDSVNSIKAHQRRLRGTLGSPRPQRVEDTTISFNEDDAKRLRGPHDDALIIELEVGNCVVARILVDGGSSVDVIFKTTLDRMSIKEAEIEHKPNQLSGFNGEVTPSLGIIELPVRAGDLNRMVEFTVLDCPSPFKAILGRPWIHEMRAVPSTYHLCVRFPTPNGIQEIRGSQEASRICYMNNHKMIAKKREPEESDSEGPPVEEANEVQ